MPASVLWCIKVWSSAFSFEIFWFIMIQNFCTSTSIPCMFKKHALAMSSLFSNILLLFWCSTEDPPLCSLPDSLWAIGSTFLFPCHPKWATANCQKSKLVFFFPCVTKKQNAKTQKAKIKIKGLLNSESSEYSRATFCDLRLVTLPSGDWPK